jgi:cytochrome c-type biogenesis protein CcmF
MPWLAGTALLHSAVVMEKRDALKVWTVLLAIVTFALSLMGTFLVRSGVLTSVHAFAIDPARGLFILGIIAFFTGGGFALFAWRAPLLRQGGLFAPISREASLVLNNLLLSTACAAVLIGTLYPLGLEALTGAKISVGPPYFNAVFLPLMIPLLIAVPFGPFLTWKRGDILGVAQRLAFAAGLAVLAAVATFAIAGEGPTLAPLGIGLGVWLIIGALSETAYRVKLFQVPLAESSRRLRGLPRSSFGTLMAHLGVGVAVLGIVATSAWRSELILAAKPGEAINFAGYTITFQGTTRQQGPNYVEDSGEFLVESDGATITTLAPSRRQFFTPRTVTSEAAIHLALAGDLYLVLGETTPEGGAAVRVYFNPLVRLIWIGALIMFFGGALSLSDRRLRIGAPARSRATGKLVPQSP